MCSVSKNWGSLTDLRDGVVSLHCLTSEGNANRASSGYLFFVISLLQGNLSMRSTHAAFMMRASKSIDYETAD